MSARRSLTIPPAALRHQNSPTPPPGFRTILYTAFVYKNVAQLPHFHGSAHSTQKHPGWYPKHLGSFSPHATHHSPPPVKSFRMNTYKSVTKQSTYSPHNPFRINTCKKMGGGACLTLGLTRRSSLHLSARQGVITSLPPYFVRRLIGYNPSAALLVPCGFFALRREIAE